MEIQFNEIVIIESLPEGEQKTGTELYEFLEARHSVPVSLHEPQTATELFRLLKRFVRRAAAGDWVPLMHWEMHGAKDVVATASEEWITWDDVSIPIRDLNIAIRNSLIMVLGACSGAFMATAAANKPFEPSPFAGLVGPSEEIYADLLPEGFKAFYTELLTSGDFNKAIAALHALIPEYTGLDIAKLFRNSREVYDRMWAPGPRLRKRVRRIVRRRRRFLLSRFGSYKKARLEIIRQIRDRSKWLGYYRRFIMADRFPENADRFPPIDLG